MNLSSTQGKRVVSGMRPTGALHLGHYHGVLKNWVDLQLSHECYFFAADWHALTTHYEDTGDVRDHVFEMIIDWLACGVNPGTATLFVQSEVPEHAELFLLLAMITPLGWLERVPSYKDQQERLSGKDLTTYGFLGYPLLQTADILMYKADLVPVGEDQVAHVELSREIARRFNYFYGGEPDFARRVERAIDKLGRKNAQLYRELRRKHQEQGDERAHDVAVALVESQQSISISDRERLRGYLVGMSRVLLPEPQALLTASPKIPGVDGQKMSKSYANTISLREPEESIEKKLRTMPTDPARKRREDPGEPEKCPVWQWHKVYSDDKRRDWVQEGCRTAGIGCVECKRPLIEEVQREVAGIRARAREYADDRGTVEKIIAEGNDAAREIARDTLEEVCRAIKLTNGR